MKPDTIPDGLSCELARERLSTRLDGEGTRDEAPLRAHLAHCAACRAHERALAQLAQDFVVLRTSAVPLPDLWPAIEARTRARPRTALLARVAAALVGFVGVGATALVLERAPAPSSERHLLERLVPLASPTMLFASLPEYRVLRAFPTPEEPR